MSNKTIGDLRDTMFETLAALRAGKISIEQAKAMSDIGQVIINSAKVEVDYIRANNGGNSAFIGDAGEEAGAKPLATLASGITGVRQHRIQG